MWQLYALGSLLAGAATSAVDKYGLVANKKVDTFVATYIRSIVFLIAIYCIGLSGVLGNAQFTTNPLIAFVAFVSVIGSFAYTYLLRRVEVLEIGAMGYLLPFIFFAIDMLVLNTRFTGEQITGILLLVIGGIAFALDGKTHHLNKELSLAALGMFVLMGVSTGAHAYVFKYLNVHDGMNSVSFYLSVEIFCAVYITGFLLFSGRIRNLWSPAAVAYLAPSIIGKSCDAIGSVLWAQALTFVAVSQVSAFSALSPLVLFILVAVGELLFKFRLKEKLDRPRAIWKAGAVCLLVAGGFLVT